MSAQPVLLERRDAVRFSSLPPLALYVHVPWCVRKCPYCDFNSHEKRGVLPESEYIDALVADLEGALPWVWGRRVSSVFIGGGTPSLLSADAVARLLSELRALRQELDAKQGELEVARLQLDRANAGISYSSEYKITADLATAIYDVALSEQLNPALAFPLVKIESNFNVRAKSKVGALGLTQVLPSTARLYEPGLTNEQLYDRETNLRLGFRYLRDLAEL